MHNGIRISYFPPILNFHKLYLNKMFYIFTKLSECCLPDTRHFLPTSLCDLVQRLMNDNLHYIHILSPFQMVSKNFRPYSSSHPF